MERKFIFLSGAMHDKLSVLPRESVSDLCHVPLQLKSPGSGTHNELTPIHAARLNLGLSIAEVCRRTGLSYDNYIKYERGTIKPQYVHTDILQRISDVLECDFFSSYHKFKLNSAEIVRAYMDERHISIRKFAAECGVSATSVKNWRSGVCAPSYEIWMRFFSKETHDP